MERGLGPSSYAKPTVKRSYRRAVRRAMQCGYTWYRGRLFTTSSRSASVCSPSESHVTASTPTVQPSKRHQRQRMLCLTWNSGGLAQAGILCMVSKRLCQVVGSGQFVHNGRRQSGWTTSVADKFMLTKLPKRRWTPPAQQVYANAWTYRQRCPVSHPQLLLWWRFNIMNVNCVNFLSTHVIFLHCCRLMKLNVPKIISDCTKLPPTCCKSGMKHCTTLPKEWSGGFLTFLPKPGGTGDVVASANGTTIRLPPQENHSLSSMEGLLFHWTFRRSSSII